jgi:hypothetical protein
LALAWLFYIYSRSQIKYIKKNLFQLTFLVLAIYAEEFR